MTWDADDWEPITGIARMVEAYLHADSYLVFFGGEELPLSMYIGLMAPGVTTPVNGMVPVLVAAVEQQLPVWLKKVA